VIPDNDNHFHVRAQLTCGAWVDIVQRSPHNILELIVTPAENTVIADTAYISSDGLLHINMTTEAMLGLYQLLRMILGQDRKKKKLFGIF
jgi:hypothetical protein